MCTKNCNGRDDCSEVFCTSDITCFDGEFQTIVVPEGSDLNDVLALIEQYVDDSVDPQTFTLVEPNCIGLSAGIYGYQQILEAVNTQICAVKSDITDLQTDLGTLTTTVEGHTTELADHESRITALETPEFLSYKAQLEQTGVADPVANILGNNDLGAIVWTRLAQGDYLGTLVGAFPQGKTFFYPSSLSSLQYHIFITRGNDDEISLRTSSDGIVLDDNILDSTFQTMLEIRVYP